jgi:hypothetical protein
MTYWNRAVFVLEFILALSTFAGLVYRQHVRIAWFFGAYLLAIAIPDILILRRPDLFTWDFWLVQQLTLSLAKLALVLELTLRIFQSLPRARANVTGLQLAILLLTLVLVAARAGGGSADVALQAMPWLQYGTAFAFIAMLGGALWYYVPLHPIHRAILLALTPYLLAFTLAIRALQDWGWDVRDLANYGSGAAFIVVLAYWTREAWRPYTVDQEHVEVFRFLRPWAVGRRT